MFDERVSIEDLRTFWKGCVAVFQGEPVFVIGVGDRREAKVKRLRDGSISTIDLTKEDLQAPDGRLGFVNLNGTVIYTQRRPVRKFMMGINDQNLHVRMLKEYLRYEAGEIHRLSTTSMEFYRTLKGEYPSLEEAIDQVKTFGGAAAFDRQFAVDEDRYLYYKMYRVGKVGRGCVDKRGLILNPGYEFLKSVIGGFDYEEASRNSRPQQ